MNGPHFFQTRMGQIFIEGTLPRLVRELSRLNGNLERLLAVVEDKPAEKPADEAEDKDG